MGGGCHTGTYSAHAEMNILKPFIKKKISSRKMRKFVLVSLRCQIIRGQIIFMIAKPCLKCRDLALSLGIEKVIYTNISGQFVSTRLRNLNSVLSSGLRTEY